MLRTNRRQRCVAVGTLRPAVEELESRRLLSTLVWSDEFDSAVGSGPDSSRWQYNLGGGGWGNAELQTYTNSRQNSSIVADAGGDGRKGAGDHGD